MILNPSNISSYTVQKINFEIHVLSNLNILEMETLQIELHTSQTNTQASLEIQIY